MIMAGGSGTRLWPMSRQGHPKQLLPLVNGRSLLELALDRIEELVPEECRWICTNEAFRDEIAEKIGFRSDRILGEPIARDTLNAVGFAAAVIGRHDPDAVLAVLTADHVIEPIERFAQCIRMGFDLVEREPDRLVTFSIVPSYASTGYGYIERGEAIEGYGEDSDGAPECGAYEVTRYIEKPDQETAQQFVNAGNYGWSSGMFAFTAGTILGLIDRFFPATHKGLMDIAESWDTDRRAETLQRVYMTLPKISIDYALLEPASSDPTIRVATVTMDATWLDIGSWPSYAETIEADGQGNRSTGPAVLVDSRGMLTVSDDPNHLIAAVGCHDLVVVHTRDSTLVCPADRCQDIKTLLEQIEKTRR